MYGVRQEDLPFQGLSHNFVGADNGDVHRHPYDEVQFVREGRGVQENLG